MIRPTRRQQPYRRGQGRGRTSALRAMSRGKPAFLNNPQDVARRTAKLARRRRRGKLARAVRP